MFSKLLATPGSVTGAAGGQSAISATDWCDSFPEFREGEDASRPTPPWAQFFLRTGYQLQAELSNARRIILLTMPCESAGAGLLTLGALRFRLAQRGADDLEEHFSRIQALARTGHTNRPLCDIRNRGKRAGPFLVGDIEQDTGHVWVQHASVGDVRRLITPAAAMNWRFQDEPPLYLQSGAQVPYRELYTRLLPGASHVCPENLSRSDSAIWLMTRPTGEAVTRAVAANIRFASAGGEIGLDELLTIRQWASERISRVVLFNTRTGEPDRCTRRPQLVVADGDIAFLRALNERDMQEADVIGVVPRNLPRDRLEALGHRLADLEQWYSRDDSLPGMIRNLPPSVAAAVLTRRAM